MKYLIALFAILFSTSSFSQEILNFSIQESPAFLIRKTDSSVVGYLKSETFFYSEDSNASIIKIRFYDKEEATWKEGFIENKDFKTFSNENNANKIKFVTNYLKEFNTKIRENKIDNKVFNATLNPLINEIIQLSCKFKNRILIKVFIETISEIHPNLDEKQLYALEEIYACNKQIVLKTLEEEIKQQEILKIIESF